MDDGSDTLAADVAYIGGSEAMALADVGEHTLEAWRLGGIIEVRRGPPGDYLYSRSDLEAAQRDLAAFNERCEDGRVARQAAELVERLRGDEDVRGSLAAVAASYLAWTGAKACRIDMLCGETAVELAGSVDAALESDAFGPVSWRTSRVSAATTSRESRAPTAITDVGTLDRAQRDGLPMAASRCASLAFVPLVHAGKAAGILTLIDDQPNTFACVCELDRSLDCVLAVAVAAAALESEVGRLHADPIARPVEGDKETDAATELRRIAERVLALLDADSCDVYLVEGGFLVPALGVGDRGASEDTYSRSLFALDDYPVGKVALDSGRPVVVSSLDDPKLTDWERKALASWGLQSQLSIPVEGVGDRRFLVEVYDTVPRDFAAEIEPAWQLCREMGQAAAAAFKVDYLERRGTALGYLVDLAAGASAAEDQAAVVRVVAQQLVPMLEVHAVDICLIQGDAIECLVSADETGRVEDTPRLAGSLVDYPLMAAALRTSEVQSVSFASDPRLSETERGFLSARGLESAVCVPLLVGDASLGFIAAYDTRAREFEAFAGLLGTVGRVVAGTLRRLQLGEQAESNEALLADVMEMAALAAQAQDVNAALVEVARRLLASLGADALDITRLDEGRLAVLISLDPQDNGERADTWSDHVSDYPFTSAAIAAGEARVLRVDDEGISERDLESLTAYGFANELLVPLRGRDRVVGFIDVFARRDRDWDDVRGYMNTVGSLVAGIVERADAAGELEKTNAQLEDLVQAGFEIGSTLDLQEVAAIAARQMCAIADVPCCDIFAAVGDGMLALASSDKGVDDLEYIGQTFTLADYGLALLCIETREPVVSADVLSDPRASEADRHDAEKWGYPTALSIPLIARGNVVGLAQCFGDKEKAFSGLSLLQALAQTVAQAIANALAYGDLDKAVTRLSLVNDVGLEFNSTLRPDDLLATLSKRLCEIMDVRACDIYRVVDEETFEVVESTVDGDECSEWEGRSLLFAEWPMDRIVVETGRTAAIGSLDDPRLNDAERDAMREWGEKALLMVPLVTPAGVIGTIQLSEYRHEREFSAEEIATVEAVARVAALALRNAELHESLEGQRRRLEGLLEANQAISGSVILERVLEDVARAAATMLGSPECSIWEYEPGAEVIVERAAFSQDPTYSPSDIVRLDERPVEKSILKSGTSKVEHLSDPGLDPASRASMEQWGEKTCLTVAVSFASEPLGLIVVLETEAERQFGADEVTALEALGTQAATAIHNARLYRQEQEQTRQRQALLDAGRAITSSVILREVLSNVAKTASTALSCSECVIHTYDAVEDALKEQVLYQAGTDGHSVLDEMRPLAEYPGGTRILLGHEVLQERLSDRDLDPVTRAAMERNGERSCLSIPLGVGADPVGIMVLVETERDRRFSAGEVEFASGIGEQAAVAIRNARLYEDIRRMHLANLRGLSTALGVKDYYTLGHAARVAGYMTLLGQKLGWSADYLRAVEEVAHLHDIGKIGIPDSILIKHGSLTDEEWDLMRQHPGIGADIIGSVLEEEFGAAIRHHHERFDGTGYPDGLVGDEIPLLARAMCVVDSYDAMSSQRPYTSSLTYSQCVEELRRCKGAQFDPELADAFLEVLVDLAQREAKLEAVAERAAARIDPAEHMMLRTRADERRPEYESLIAVLREVRDQNPSVRAITTYAHSDDRFAIIGDSREEKELRSHVGDGRLAEEEVQRRMADEPVDIVALRADEYGLWLNATAPVRNADGEVVAVVAASASGAGSISAGLRNDQESTFATALENQALQLTRAEIEATTDGLTGLHNHRYLQDRLTEELARVRESDGQLALVFCDLDHFKAFNDHYGHSAGDTALRHVARAVERCVRRVDVATRYGGEEIVVILVDTGLEAAVEVAERIRQEVAQTDLGPGLGAIRVSVGVACYPDHAKTKPELLDRADWAMYRAKRLGRDRVVVSDGQDAAQPAAPESDRDYAVLYEVAAAVDARKSRTGAASDACLGDLARALGDELDLGPEEHALVSEAARLHDIGQVGVPDEILGKPERLTAEEWEVIREHPRIGARLVAESGGSGKVAETIAHHHEHWDGRGYPDGLAGAEIPLASRVIAVADAYCAMRSARPQRAARSPEQALAEVRRRAGSQFDPRIVEAFVTALEHVRTRDGGGGAKGKSGGA